MKIISTSYISSPEFTDPVTWLQRIDFYTGILEELAKQHEVVGIEAISYQGGCTQKGVQYIFLNFKRKKLYFPGRMHRLIHNLGPDIVFINGFIFPLQIIQLRLKLRGKAKIIVLHRAEKPFNGIRRYLQKLADHCIDGYLFSSSEFGKPWMQQGIIKSRRKIHEVMQASSRFLPGDSKTAKKLSGVSGFPVFLWVGRLDNNKDPLTVVSGFMQFLQHQPEARLYMIYQEGELLKEVERKIDLDRKTSANIQLVGKVSRHELNAWYNSADFIISGSHYEGSGIAVSEAMSCGCIPILTDIPSFRRMSGMGNCGFLYRPGHDQDLLSALLKTKELDLSNEKEKVLRQFNDELSFEAIARKINRIIEA